MSLIPREFPVHFPCGRERTTSRPPRTESWCDRAGSFTNSSRRWEPLPTAATPNKATAAAGLAGRLRSRLARSKFTSAITLDSTSRGPVHLRRSSPLPALRAVQSLGGSGHSKSWRVGWPGLPDRHDQRQTFGACLEIVRIRVSLPPTWFSPPPAHLSVMPSNRSKVSLIRHAPLRRALTELPLPVTMPATSPSRLFVDVCTSTKVHEELSGQGYDAFR